MSSSRKSTIVSNIEKPKTTEKTRTSLSTYTVHSIFDDSKRKSKTSQGFQFSIENFQERSQYFSADNSHSIETVISDTDRRKQALYKPDTLDPRSGSDVPICLYERRTLSEKLTADNLETGFGIHTQDSLDSVLRKLKVGEENAEEEEEEEVVAETYSEYSTKIEEKTNQSIDNSTETDNISVGKHKLEYLMGLEETKAEEFDINYKDLVQGFEEDEVNVINGTSEAMREAQRYLRMHKIFEFFQFLIAHMLSASPYNPIDFLLNLLDKCLIYRSGIGKPPLLYDLPHIECLFNLMDRMRFGYIDFQQYKTGLLTLGIRSFNEHPPLKSIKGSKEKVVEKDVFIQEAYNGLTDLFDDMIRRYPNIKTKIYKLPRAPPPTTTDIGVRL